MSPILVVEITYDFGLRIETGTERPCCAGGLLAVNAIGKQLRALMNLGLAL